MCFFVVCGICNTANDKKTHQITRLVKEYPYYLFVEGTCSGEDKKQNHG